MNQNYLLEASKEAKTKLSDLVPGMKELEGERMSALIYSLKKKVIFISVHSNNTKKDILATQTLEQLVVDIGNIRTHLNTTELQLYEANEKISELIENVNLFYQSNVKFKMKIFIISNSSNISWRKKTKL